jgi:ankyrin repeat protein
MIYRALLIIKLIICCCKKSSNRAQERDIESLRRTKRYNLTVALMTQNFKRFMEILDSETTDFYRINIDSDTTILNSSIFWGNYETTLAVLNKNVNVNLETHVGTALVMAAHRSGFTIDNFKIIQELVHRGANVNYRSAESRHTPLMICAYNSEKLPILKHLLPHADTESILSSIDIARSKNNSAALEALEEELLERENWSPLRSSWCAAVVMATQQREAGISLGGR